MTKTQRTITSLFVLILLVTAGWSAQRAINAASEDGIAVYFSPNGGCTDAIIQEIIHVQAYSFTSARLAKALVDASKRDLIVRVLLDSSQRTAQYSSYTFFQNQGIPVFIDSKHAIAHNKVMVIDGRTVITGSFNFTKAAEERNAENVLIIKGKRSITRAYMDNIEQHLAHSVGDRASDRDQPTAPDDDAASVTVYVTKTGTKYHKAGCRYLRTSSKEATLKDAKRRGLTPCKVCRP